MSEPKKRAPRRGWIALAMAVLLAYPLSIGPFFALFTRKMLPPEMARSIGRFYEPLWLLAERTELFANVLKWYISFWHATL